ncbi:hypothetical protein RJ639_009438 [Escallonia herrerae]|uniref:PXMP2/4 family protein 4 n=1 Tax=Escallonia herrerae TaxID=1293975 RepID=A0AA88VYP0_9ASTE|nr:hypothetical protein RJ639_009438 [Escallonia herrerae]
MSGGFLRNGVRSHYSLWRRHSIADQIGPPTIRSHYPQQQSKAYARFPHSFYRKSKDLDLSLPSVPTSPFSSASASRIPLVGWYLGLIKTKPILTKSITSALIYTAADLSSQTIASSEPYDLVRTLRMAGYGMMVVGPSLHLWFNFMAKVLPKRDLITTTKKIALGQTVYGPTLTVVFFSLNAGLQGLTILSAPLSVDLVTVTLLSSILIACKVLCRSLSCNLSGLEVLPSWVLVASQWLPNSGENGAEIIARLKRDLLPTMMSGVMYWPFCDFVTFRFVPVHLQPLVSNSFSYLWSVYLTYMASLEKADTKALRSS